MEHIKVVNFLERKKDFLFPNQEYSDIKLEEALINAPDWFEHTMEAIPFRNPSTVHIISIFVGSLGVDRFYLGDIKKGILKYFTFGGIGIWWIKDIFSAKSRCRAYNCKKLLDALNDPSVVAKMQQTDAKIKKTGDMIKTYGPEVIKVTRDAINDFQDTMMPK